MSESQADPRKTFQELMDRMEAVVERLETGNLPLEESLALFEEGVSLSRQAAARLESAEKRVEELLADGSVAPFVEAARAAGGAAPSENQGA